MLDATEQTLSQIGSGEVKLEDGLDRLETELTEIVKNAGFLTQPTGAEGDRAWQCATGPMSC